MGQTWHSEWQYLSHGAGSYFVKNVRIAFLIWNSSLTSQCKWTSTQPCLQKFEKFIGTAENRLWDKISDSVQNKNIYVNQILCNLNVSDARIPDRSLHCTIGISLMCVVMWGALSSSMISFVAFVSLPLLLSQPHLCFYLLYVWTKWPYSQARWGREPGCACT